MARRYPVGAIVRLNVLWQLWENARIEDDPAAMGSWVGDWFDGLVPALVSPSETFAGRQNPSTPPQWRPRGVSARLRPRRSSPRS